MTGSNETFDFIGTVDGERDEREAQLTFPWLAPFPVQALPEPIATFSLACAESLPAPVEMIAVPALVTAAAAIGNARAIELKADWTEPSSLFAAVVSPSGTKKTPALKKAVQPIQDLDCDERRTWTGDVTVERLAGLLADHPRGLLYVGDELSAWVKSMNQYKAGGKGADRQFYLSAWAGAAIKVDRKGGQVDGPSTISVTRPCLSVIGCIPPDVVPALEASSGEDDGFLPRLLFSWPETSAVRWVDEAVPDYVQATYANKIKELIRLPFDNGRVNLPLTSDARDLWVPWHDHLYAELECIQGMPFLRAAFAKLSGYCARLALVHAVTSNPSTTAVGPVSMESAIKLIGYFGSQARKVMSLFRSEQGDIHRCAEAIKRKLSVCRSIKKRDLQRNSGFPADVFNPALQTLAQPFLSIQGSDVTLYEPTNRQL
jgi:hypothetical protein